MTMLQFEYNHKRQPANLKNAIYRGHKWKTSGFKMNVIHERT